MKKLLSGLKQKIRIKHIPGIGLFLFLLTIFVFYGPPDMITRTSTPEFCAGCHVMDYQYDAWLKTGLHRSIKCVDCHLPNNNPVNHFVWKGIDGMKDVVYFYGRLYGDDIRASDRAVGVIHANCVRCHGEMVSRMSTDGNTCWSCHRRVNHRVLLSGIE